MAAVVIYDCLQYRVSSYEWSARCQGIEFDNDESHRKSITRKPEHYCSFHWLLQLITRYINRKNLSPMRRKEPQIALHYDFITVIELL